MPGKLLNKTLAVRSLSGAAFVAVVVAAVLVSPWTFGALLMAMTAGCMWEFYKLSAAAGAEPQRGLGIALGVAVIAGGWVAVMTGCAALRIIATAIIPAIFTVFIVELYRKREQPLLNIATTLTGIVYVAVPLLLFLLLANRAGAAGEHTYRPLEALTYFVIIWANDTGAYLIGVIFGRHRLFERISPKKSWEGFWGGLVFAVAVAFFAARMMGNAPEQTYIWAGLGLVAALGGVFGDLVESMFKRAAGVKDSGTLMPGHGGWLDRFDAMLISLPFAFLYYYLFIP